MATLRTIAIVALVVLVVGSGAFLAGYLIRGNETAAARQLAEQLDRNLKEANEGLERAGAYIESLEGRFRSADANYKRLADLERKRTERISECIERAERGAERSETITAGLERLQATSDY